MISVSLGLLYLHFSKSLSATETWVFLCSGLVVALSGFLDDKLSLRPSVRLVMQFVAVAISLYGLGSISSITFFSWEITNSAVLLLLSVFFLMWLINLYNFMDGINGIAGLQAVSVGLFMSVIHYLALGSVDYISLFIAVTSLGFLYWNFPGGRIFMGDVGSGYLGLMIGLVSLMYARTLPDLLYPCLILMGVFIVDATYTLGYRFIQCKKIHQAHSSHAYQHLARRTSHSCVSLGILAINSLWLFPLSLLVIWGYLSPWVGLILAYSPLLLIVIKSNAGLDESQLTKSTS